MAITILVAVASIAVIALYTRRAVAHWKKVAADCQAECDRLNSDQRYAESLIRRLLAKYEPDGCASYGTQERSEDRHIH